MNIRVKSGFWKILALALVVLFLVLAVNYLKTSLPKPQITLTFQGFKTGKSNTYSIICFSNGGKSTVWWDGHLWDLEIETPKGWTTNQIVHFTTVPSAVRPGSNYLAGMVVPQDAIRWRVHAVYIYYDHHHVRYELADWFLRHHRENVLFGPIGESMGWLLRLLPEPKERDADVSTGFLTNRMPISTNLAPRTRQ